jgi:hypothetical protein
VVRGEELRLIVPLREAYLLAQREEGNLALELVDELADGGFFLF